MFVAAGLGQLGANGQLLSPLFGSRCRLAIVSTDAPVTYGEPVDHGIHKFCQECQVCVRRCPARALVKEQVWWRGVHKNKVTYDRCRPVMARYAGCGVCMKVCPIQRYGMKAVMEHYVATGQVLGKGTDDLEGFTLSGKYFGVGELPALDRKTFHFPHGPKDEWLFQQFKEKLKKDGVPPDDQLQRFATDVKRILDKGLSTRYDQVPITRDTE
jgi:Pyruvate/2-oxoacid:ferredoxin oxidoreductase delta subunit